MQSDNLTDHNKAWLDAAARCDEESLRHLLKLGADINTVDANKNTALHHATKQAHIAIMHFLIENGADLNAQNDRSSTPLHLTEKNIDTIRILLEAGADPNIKDADWDYPYYFAFYGSMTRELTDLYIKHGAHLEYADKSK
ncbi:ankyrin repeat domain-containing protein [Mariprofundus micogutta]|uniref:Ankyrin repeat domain-containing protein n=1 Tax=Mariprofundus micogutta TaxID=1921010 RepID=A0A1L8CMZ3_9PROT|nr:ankyrin repeat domain-containing protein [Mariprofundus micogutta]